MFVLPLSKSQVDKLGDRLRDLPEPDPADVELLESVLLVYDQALQIIEGRLRLLGYAPSIRQKVTATIIKKLRRDRGFKLRAIQDLVGARVVFEGDLDLQDVAVDRFCAAHDKTEPIPKKIDRRVDPRSGYRAVHAVARVHGIPVEVQFRTALQHRWAQIFERLADAAGRDIRYGGQPDAGIDAGEVIEMMLILSANIAGFEELSCSEAIKEMKADVAGLQIDYTAADEDLSEFHRQVRSNYLAYLKAFREARGQLERKLTELSDRAELMGRPA